MRLLVLCRAGHHGAVPALLLGAIERRIGHLQDLVCGVFRPIRRGNSAQAHRDIQRSGFCLNGPLEDGLAEPLRLLCCFRAIAARKQDQELLAAIAAHGVIGPDVGLHSSCNFPEHGVSGKMSVGVIDGLEVIQVRNQYAQGRTFPARPGNFAIQCFQNRATVPHSGQRIVRGFESHGLAGLHKVVFEFEEAQSDAKPRLQFLRNEMAWSGNHPRRIRGPQRRFLWRPWL